MRIAVLSDTHGRIAAVEAALREIAARGIATIVHCGDIDDAETVPLFPSGTHFVFGNCDTDRSGIERAIAAAGGILHGAWGHLELDGVTLAFTHSDDRALMRELENSDFDYLFYGHTHIAREHKVGRTRVINPGALQRANPKSFIVLDLANGEIERIVI